jgi:hypothetical protein
MTIRYLRKGYRTVLSRVFLPTGSLLRLFYNHAPFYDCF